jgi:glucokinase
MACEMSQNAGMKCGLVADVGGTNVRFALVDLDAPGPLAVHSAQHFATRDYAGMAEAANTYLKQHAPSVALKSACFAVAGPVSDGKISFTNSDWAFSEKELGKKLGGTRVRLINDFEATAYAIPHLGKSDVTPIGPDVSGADGPQKTFCVLGPGTGLGMAGLVRDGARDVALVTEGGHAGFAPGNALEVAVLEFLRKRYDHVSRERLLSGAGLRNLYDAMCEIDGVDNIDPKPEDVTAEAMRNAQSFCARVFGAFCAILGSAAGDAALTMGARGGVYLAGGILPDAVDFLQKSAFRARFTAKGRFHDYLAAIPTFLIVHPYAALLGAASRLADTD